VKAHLFVMCGETDMVKCVGTFVCYVWGNRHGEVCRHICLQLPIASMLFSEHHIVISCSVAVATHILLL